jgi:hypothetical protein
MIELPPMGTRLASLERQDARARTSPLEVPVEKERRRKPGPDEHEIKGSVGLSR